MLEQSFPSGSLDVQDSRTGACRSITVREYQSIASGTTLSKPDCATYVAPISNAINLRRLARADEPLLTRLPRFRLLSTLVSRLQTRQDKNPGQPTTAGRPIDVESSSLGFNLLGLPGAFSRAHVDCLLGTWARCLHGIKIWAITSTLEDADWRRFTTQGANWNPCGKGRIAVLEQDDVLLMPPGVRCIHAVFTPVPTLVEGGMLWDERNIPQLLDGLRWVAENQLCTNEAVPYQLPKVIDALEQWTTEQAGRLAPDGNGEAYLALVRDKIGKLRALGCVCTSDCSVAGGCPCKTGDRRCTSWCKKHPELPPPMGKNGRDKRGRKVRFACMAEHQPTG
ncbi:hypothetical protein K461DRAFT_230059 [Myriangium duriaei CBS 260.36]|uniref:JmjC domain-containing protein n=1 Tax=Myriangium duriaei CBS 260.36 TaxID=1168546 RepID=A0A9P4MEP6_9PEZI|nr:hypothetical protein K461DRAFT_230059 [Myriangium duriaei CBS 260.36]